MIDDTWVKNTWEFLLTHSFEVKAHEPSFQVPRSCDTYLMDDINELQIPSMDKSRLNLCRIYLQVLTLSHITDAGGTTLLECTMDGRRDDT